MSPAEYKPPGGGGGIAEELDPVAGPALDTERARALLAEATEATVRAAADVSEAAARADDVNDEMTRAQAAEAAEQAARVAALTSEQATRIAADDALAGDLAAEASARAAAVTAEQTRATAAELALDSRADAIETTLSNVLSIGEIQNTVYDSTAPTASGTTVVMVAEFALVIKAVSFGFKFALNGTAGNFWTLFLQRFRANIGVNFWSKSNYSVNQYGQNIQPLTDWNYDAIPVDQWIGGGANHQFLKGDILVVAHNVTTSGTAGTLPARAITVRYEPL